MKRKPAPPKPTPRPVDPSKDLTALKRPKGARSGLAQTFALPITGVCAVAGLAVTLAPFESAKVTALVALGILVIVAWIVASSASRPIQLLVQDVEAMARGAPPKGAGPTTGDVAVVAAAMRDMWRNLERGEQLRRSLLVSHEDRRTAADLWECLRPAHVDGPAGYDIALAQRSDDALASTLLAWLPASDGRAMALLLEASGSGTAGVILLSTARAYARALAPAAVSPRTFLIQLNALLSPELPPGTYVTAACIVLDPTSGEGLYASAGHRVSALRVSDRGAARRLQTEGIALGFDSSSVFDHALGEAPLSLAVGDALVIASEGLIAAESREGPVGEAGLARAVIAALAHEGNPAETTLDLVLGGKATRDSGLLILRRLEGSPSDVTT